MAGQLTWHIDGVQLLLSGALERETLLALWNERETIMKQIDTINVTDLERVDSAGLALLVHLRKIALQQGRHPQFTGVNDKLQSLITLYNLQQIIVSQDTMR